MDSSKKVTSAPKLIDPMDKDYFSSEADNLRDYLYALKHGKVLGHPYLGADLVSYRNNYRVLDHNQKKVVYLMKWETRKFLGREAAYQVLVWSDPRTDKMRGYAPQVFFDQLFSKTGLICTDRIQTPQGSRFWTSVISRALGFGFFAYFADLNSHPRQYAPLTQEKFNDLDNKGLIWTRKEKGKGQLLLISKEPISEIKEPTISGLENYPTLRSILEED